MKLKEYFKSGEAYVWLNAGAVAICLIMVMGLLSLIAIRGLSYFWPSDIMQVEYEINGEKTTYIGELFDSKTDSGKILREDGIQIPDDIKDADKVTRLSLKVGNKDLHDDFIWVTKPYIKTVKYPKDLVKLERLEYGNFYGRLKSVKIDGTEITGDDAVSELEKGVKRSRDLYLKIKDIEKVEMGAINYDREQIRLEERRLELNSKLTEQALATLNEKRADLDKKSQVKEKETAVLNTQLARDSATFVTADGTVKEYPLGQIIHMTQPNKMGFFAKMGEYFSNIWHFLSGDPREANTEGGVFPAIFGTIMMVLIMTVIVTPLGVIAAIYLREYASQGRFTQMVRVAVNNLAGVPSIVYGVFGLGFMVYLVGGEIDKIFYPEYAPIPVFGTPGIMWAAITLALLTLPVVIVATEEGLSRIPRNLKEGSLALGATKAETLWKVILPICAPSIMTGMILAIARAAGEVAPLMLVGVVKSAPELALDFNAPFLHLDRKFMHLGFHIYDVGFQSPNVEAARPLVYATALLLVTVIALLNLSAIAIRNKLREKYKSLS